FVPPCQKQDCRAFSYIAKADRVSVDFDSSHWGLRNYSGSDCCCQNEGCSDVNDVVISPHNTSGGDSGRDYSKHNARGWCESKKHECYSDRGGDVAARKCVCFVSNAPHEPQIQTTERRRTIRRRVRFLDQTRRKQLDKGKENVTGIGGQKDYRPVLVRGITE